MRAVIWAAVSSKPQAEESKASLPQQITDSRVIIERNDWLEAHPPLVVDGHTRSYTGISPLLDACADMPQYATLVELARSDSIDIVVCRSRDRLGRTDVLVSEIEGYLRTHGCQVYNLDMPARIQDPEEFRSHRDKAGLWTAAIERAKAEDEVATLQTRYQFGMRGRVQSGLHPNNLPFGYRKGPDGVGVIIEEEARLVRLIFDWYIAGVSARAIRDRLPQYANGRYPRSDAGVAKIISNPYYCGMVSWRRIDEGRRQKPRSEWITGEGLHKPIIEYTIWEQAQRERRARPGSGQRGAYTAYPLSGLVVCGLCGAAMTVQSTVRRGKTYRYYACCRGQSVNLGDLEHLVAEWICSVATGAEEAQDVFAELREREQRGRYDQREALEASQARTTAALERWQEDYELGLIERAEFYAHRIRLSQEAEGIAAELERLQPEGPTEDQARDALERLSLPGPEELATSWRDKDTALATKAELRRLGVRITVTGGVATVELGLPHTVP